jgi:hypothetical protein
MIMPQVSHNGMAPPTADIPARKEEGIDDIGVRRQREPVASCGHGRKIETGLVLEQVEFPVVETGNEEVLDKIMHRLATSTM